MLSERRRLSDVATCCSASGDVMHCAGTADHSTHEGTLDTGSTATDRPADTVKNASDSQVVLLYSAGSSFVFENRKRQSGSSEEAKHGSRLRYVGISAAARTPYTARTSLAHTAAQSRLAHCPATSTAAAKPAHKRSLFLIFDEKMSFVRGFCRWRRVSLQRRRPAARGHHPICCSTEPPRHKCAGIWHTVCNLNSASSEIVPKARQKSAIRLSDSFYPRVHAQTQSYSVRRASIARPSVSSSAYSRSPPTGRPLARRLTSMPRGLMVRAK